MTARIIITRYGRFIMTVLHDGNRIVDMNVDDAENMSDVGSIYVGTVVDIVKNINAAFIEYKKGTKGYFSIGDNPAPIFLNHKNNQKLCKGDQIIVRLSKEALKTKDPVLSSKLEISGKYAVLTTGDTRISFSGKFKDEEKKKRLSGLIKEKQYEETGFIIRTNAMDAEDGQILEEIHELRLQYENIISNAPYRTGGSKLYGNAEGYLVYVRDMYKGTAEEVVTDDEEIFKRLNEEFTDKRIRKYEDDMLPLSKLYQIEGTIEGLLKKKVWLKSGAYIIIEPTETLTVIDVNTGKCIKGCSNDEVFYKVNKEAAAEIVRQIRLRNISGIIIIDFINMKDETLNHSLLRELKTLVSSEHIKTTVVDMTKLGLVEITRKKIKPPFHEVFISSKENRGNDEDSII